MFYRLAGSFSHTRARAWTPYDTGTYWADDTRAKSNNAVFSFSLSSIDCNGRKHIAQDEWDRHKRSIYTFIIENIMENWIEPTTRTTARLESLELILWYERSYHTNTQIVYDWKVHARTYSTFLDYGYWILHLSRCYIPHLACCCCCYCCYYFSLFNSFWVCFLLLTQIMYLCVVYIFFLWSVDIYHLMPIL